MLRSQKQEIRKRALSVIKAIKIWENACESVPTECNIADRGQSVYSSMERFFTILRERSTKNWREAGLLIESVLAAFSTECQETVF